MLPVLSPKNHNHVRSTLVYPFSFVIFCLSVIKLPVHLSIIGLQRYPINESTIVIIQD
jgi:hypothetical protein